MKNRFYQIVRLFLAAALVISSLALAASKTSAADGDLDPTFDTDGRVTTDFNGIGDFGKSIAIQSDGKILVAGSTNVVGSSGFALARYNVDGSLDLSFDVDGKVTTLVAGGLIGANAIAVAPDGKIVVVGVGRPSGGQFDFDFAAARYNPNGSLDTTFNSTGIIITRFSTFDDSAQAVTIQPDGKIVVAGQSFTAEVSGISVFALVRYNTNGSLDTSFDGDGKLSTEFAAGNADVRSVFLQSDGKIVAAGNRNLARYLGNGTLDNTFGGGGRVLISGMNIFAAAIQPDGGIVIAGSGSPVQFSDFAVGRITPAGFFDPTFDTDGRVFVDFGTTNDSARSLVIQSDGKIVTAGFAGVTDSSVFALTRHNTDGSLDTTFSGDGKETTAFTVPNSAASGVALQSDGKIVAAGTAGGSAASDFALARYQNGGAPAASVTIGGRAVTAGGRGISKVRISLTDASGNVRTVSTSSFGYYSFTGVGTGQTYTLTARAKRATFANSPQVVFISGARGDLDFNALP